MAANNNSSVTFTAREMEVLALAWQCMKTTPQIDMPKLARLAGYTTASAATVFGNIKRKLKLVGDSLSDSGPATPKSNKTATPQTTGKRGRGKVAEEDTPSKKAKKGGSAKKKMTEEDDDEDFGDRKIKKEELIDGDAGDESVF